MEQTKLIGSAWSRVAGHAGDEFKTVTGKPFYCKLENRNRIDFYHKDGRRISRNCTRATLEKAVGRCPLHVTTEIKDLFCYAYLSGLVTDARIRGSDW